MCASVDGFTLHPATRAGALDTAGREALLRYVLRPPIAQVRLERRPDGLVLARTLAIDVLSCPTCGGRMKLLAIVTESKSVMRYLVTLGEPSDVPVRSPNRGLPYWKSTVLRRRAGGEGR